MVKFGGEIGTLYQIFTPCTPLPQGAQQAQGRCKAHQEEEG